MKRVIGLSLFAGIVFVNFGCRTTCERRPLFGCCHTAPARQVIVPPPQPAPLFQGQPGGAIQPSGGFPIAPSAQQPMGAFPTAPPSQQPMGGFPMAPPPDQQAPMISKSPPEHADTQWQPGEGREPVAPPDPPREARPRIQLYAPEPIDRDAPRSTDEPPIGKKASVLGTFPAIPQFAVAKEKVFAGLRPPLDGLDWLQQNGVQTVVHVRLEGEDDAADKRHVEKRNMRYVVFEVSPMTLTKEKSEEFIKLVRDGARQGIFVYDKDGSLAGSMWYLYLRHGEILDDEPSQLRAVELGLQNNRDGQYRTMWLAVQKVLSER